MGHSPEAAIGLFDSGVGGLTVVRALQQRLPDEPVIYLGDPARFPYGTKSAETIVRFALEDARFLVARGVKMVVVACHTAASIALPELVRELDVPVLGVIEPGARAVVAATRVRKVGVIGTSATVRAGAYARAIRGLAPDIEILAKATPLFVSLAEEGWLTGEVPELVAREYLRGLAAEGIDAILLGCTHFPLLAPVISRVLGSGVKLVDASTETAAAVEQMLVEKGLLAADSKSAPERGQPDVGRPRRRARARFYFSDMTPDLEVVAERFLGGPLEDVVRATI